MEGAADVGRPEAASAVAGELGDERVAQSPERPERAGSGGEVRRERRPGDDRLAASVHGDGVGAIHLSSAEEARVGDDRIDEEGIRSVRSLHLEREAATTERDAAGRQLSPDAARLLMDGRGAVDHLPRDGGDAEGGVIVPPHRLGPLDLDADLRGIHACIEEEVVLERVDPRAEDHVDSRMDPIQAQAGEGRDVPDPPRRVASVEVVDDAR